MSDAMTEPTAQQRAHERALKLQQANTVLYFACKRVMDAEAELADAQREHTAAVRRVEQLEQVE